MKNKRPPVPAIVLILILVLVGGYYGYQNLLVEAPTGLSASGTIETVSVNISPELGGTVINVLADEGDLVQSGDLLFSQSDEVWRAQRDIAQTGLDAAKAAAVTAQASLNAAETQYDLVYDTVQKEDAQSRTADWSTDAPNDFDQPIWYFNHDEQYASAQESVDAALVILNDAEDYLTRVMDRTTSADFIALEKALIDARERYLIAEELLARAKDGNDNTLVDAAQILLDEDQLDLEDAQKDYDDYLATDDAADIIEARADVAVAKEYYDIALDRLRALETGEQSPKLVTAQRAVEQAQAMLEQSQVAIAQAEANLALLDTQIAKLKTYASVTGTVLTRNIEPGEFVQPGATLFVLADLNDLKITVYVPEDRYGEISLGQQATLSVDSFPGETFSAVVTYISSSAEYTPRNIQTVEGRSSTVYAVKLKVDDPAGKLKPGMPADVSFR
jgi:multidrug resistance efflux pump